MPTTPDRPELTAAQRLAIALGTAEAPAEETAPPVPEGAVPDHAAAPPA